MSKIELRGVIVPSDYDTEWAAAYIERGMLIPESYFRRQLADADVSQPLSIYVNSPGGSVFAANEMANAVLDWKMTNNQSVNVIVGAMAASAASAFTISVADSVSAHSNAKMMFHGAWTLSLGGAELHKDTADLLNKINGDIMAKLVSKYDLAPETVSEWFAEGREGWLTAEDMTTAGIASEIIGDSAEMLEFPTEAVADFEQRGIGIAALLQTNAISDADGTYDCECVECGHTESGDEHCADLKCPECGGQMRRAERPGRGRNEADGEADDASDDTDADNAATDDGDADDDADSDDAPAGEPATDDAAADEPAAPDGAVADNAPTADDEARFEAGRTSVMDEMVPKLESLQAKLADAEAQTRKMQSERDKITDEYAKAKDRHDTLVADMTEKLRIANDRLAKFLNGGLAFCHMPMTWDEAKAECGGHEQAAIRYPELQAEYNRTHSHK